MAPAAVTGGVPDSSVAFASPRLRLHVEGARLAVVHATADGPSPLSQQLRDSNFQVVVVQVGRSMVYELLALAPDVVIVAPDGEGSIVRFFINQGGKFNAKPDHEIKLPMISQPLIEIR